jgi:hypothetical protein
MPSHYGHSKKKKGGSMVANKPKQASRRSRPMMGPSPMAGEQLSPTMLSAVEELDEFGRPKRRKGMGQRSLLGGMA